MESHIRIEGCENGYLLTLVEHDEEWNSEQTRWIASTTAELRGLLDNVIPDIQHGGVE